MRNPIAYKRKSKKVQVIVYPVTKGFVIDSYIYSLSCHAIARESVREQTLRKIHGYLPV